MPKVRSSISSDISDKDDDESYNQDDFAVIAEILRAKHQADMKLSRSDIEARKADEYLQGKKDHLISIYDLDVGEEKGPLQRDFRSFTYEDCLELKLTVAEEPVEHTGDKRQLSKALQEKAQMIDLEAEIRVKLTKN